MSEQEKRQDVQGIKVSSFAETVRSRRTPVGNVLLKPLYLATGTLFKLNGGTTEQVSDPDNQGQTIDHAAYRVSTLNSRLLPINTELIIKIRGQK